MSNITKLSMLSPSNTSNVIRGKLYNNRLTFMGLPTMSLETLQILSMIQSLDKSLPHTPLLTRLISHTHAISAKHKRTE
jgi:hypothetical protein